MLVYMLAWLPVLVLLAFVLRQFPPVVEVVFFHPLVAELLVEQRPLRLAYRWHFVLLS